MTDMTHIFGSEVKGATDARRAARRSNRRFVRSAGQLAEYEPDWRPTGHVLTAWEAVDAFGLDKLEEAFEYGSAILKRSEESVGQALRRRREALSLERRTVARAASVPEQLVAAVESSRAEPAIRDANPIAFVLGMDERMLAFRPCGADDDGLAVRLRTLRNPNREARHAGPVSADTALSFAEAASIVRTQHRLSGWLGIAGERERFRPEEFYGTPQTPAWKVGYDLAVATRNLLGLGRAPIPSMRELVEARLGIPVVQAPLPGNPEIAGATVATTDEFGAEVRGIVLNTLGANENVWIRRATLAHELGHLLYDPEQKLQRLKIDSYEESGTDPRSGDNGDFVEQRANAFAIAFLAPNDAVREVAPIPLSADSVARTMRTFGIGKLAATYRIYNSHYRQYEIPGAGTASAEPSDEQKAAENFATDFFPFRGATDRRRGRFAYMAAKCCRNRLISEHTAALYLQCPVEDISEEKLDLIISLHE